MGMIVHMGSNNVVYAGVVLTHDLTMEKHNFIAANTTVGGSVGNNCFMGIGSVVRNRLNVLDYALDGAGAYLEADTEEKDVFVSL